MDSNTENPTALLTPKQEKFCHGIMEGMTQSDAYRNAYNAENMLAKTIHERASVLMRDNKIKARLTELRAPAVKKAQKSYDQWLQELEEVAFVKTERLEVKMPDKLKALEIYGKATGIYREKAADPPNPLETASTQILLMMLEEIEAQSLPI